MVWQKYKTVGWVVVATGLAATGLLWNERKDPTIKARDAAEVLTADVERAACAPFTVTTNVHVDALGTNRVGAWPTGKMIYESIPDGIRALTGRRTGHPLTVGYGYYVEPPTNAAGNFHGYRLDSPKSTLVYNGFPCDFERIGQSAAKNANEITDPDWSDYAGWWETYVYTQAQAFAWESIGGGTTGYYSKAWNYNTNVLNRYDATLSRIEWAIFCRVTNPFWEFTNAATCWFGYNAVTNYSGTEEDAFNNAVAGLTVTSGVDTASAAAIMEEFTGATDDFNRPMALTYWTASTVGTQIVARVAVYAVRGQVLIEEYPAITNVQHRAQWYVIANRWPEIDASLAEFNNFGLNIIDAGNRFSLTTYFLSTNTWSWVVTGEWTNAAAYWSPEFGPTNAPPTPTYASKNAIGWYPQYPAIAVQWKFEACTNKSRYWP